MDRALIALAVVGFAAPALAGCVDASALPFASTDTTIEIPSLKHGQVTTSEVDMMILRFSSGTAGYDVDVLPVRVEQAVRDGVHVDRDRYAQPADAVWIETETTVVGPTPEGVPESWTSRNAIETGGGHVLYHGVTSPRSLSLGGNNPFADAAFNDWCATDLEVPGGIPYYASTPTRFDRAALYGTTLVAGEDVVREYDTEIYVGPGERETAHVTITWEAVGQAEFPIVMDGKERTLPALEYRVEAEYAYPSQPEGHGEEGQDGVDLRTRVWYADGIPDPVRTVSTFRFGDTTYTLSRTVTGFDAGGGALAVGDGEPAVQFDGLHPDAALAAWAFAPDLTGLGLEFPFDDAVAVLHEDPRAVEAALWFERHADAVAVQGEYTRDLANDTYRWEFTFTDDGDVLYATVTRSQPPVAGLPGDEPERVYVWDDHPFALPQEAVAGLAVADAATAFDVAKAFLPESDSWYSLSFGVAGFYEEGAWRFGPTPYYNLAHGGHAEKGDLFTQYEKEWRSPIVTVDGSTAGLAGGVGAGLSCGGGGLGLPLFVTA